MSEAELMLSRVRMELGDTAKTFVQEFYADGESTRYQLDRAPVDADSTTVLLNGVDVSDDCAIEEPAGVLIFDVPPPRDSRIVVSGICFRFFTDSELQTIIAESSVTHFGKRTNSAGFALSLENMDPVEELPLAIWSSINALYVLLTDATFDIDIYAPDGVNIPRSERWRQLMQTISQKEARYKELSSMLGVGLYAVEIFSLRRISYRTNRYVPIYIPKEIDDRDPWVRVRLPIPTYGAPPPPDTGVEIYDLSIAEGSTFIRIVEVTSDDQPYVLTGDTAKMQIRRSVSDPTAVLTLTEQDGLVIDGPAGTITMTITDEQTEDLPDFGVYDLEVYPPDGSVIRILQGRVFVNQQVTQ